MKATPIGLVAGIASMCVLGCTGVSAQAVSRSTSVSLVEELPSPPSKPKPRQWSAKQLNLLQTFALQESPKLWQTVQGLRAEHEMRASALSKLRYELVDFGRNPDADPDYASLKAANDGLMESLNAIYAKIEDAHIAYKKFQATPGRKEYGDMMRNALEDGIQEADSVMTKFQTMSRDK